MAKKKKNSDTITGIFVAIGIMAIFVFGWMIAFTILWGLGYFSMYDSDFQQTFNQGALFIAIFGFLLGLVIYNEKLR